MQTFIADSDYGLPRMKLPDLQINYTPIDPDHLDRPVVSICIENATERR